jgi:regulator of sirC expression with transglutaminase-like and TPR domain
MMNNNEIKALVYLLDDEDGEVTQHVEQRILSLGSTAIPYLEAEWESNFNPVVQHKIEDLIHELQFSLFEERLLNWKNGGAMDLLEGMWILATYHYPDLEIDKLKATIHQLYTDIWIQFQDEMSPVEKIKRINSIFFGLHKFAANTKNFHSPTNSMINVVLESRKGNPITLCTIYLLIAQRLNLNVYGVNLPNLFVLTYKDEDIQFYINVFNKGIVFSRSDIDHYIAQLNIKPKDLFYQPCTNLEIVQRVLRNLIFSYEKTGDQEKVKELNNLLNKTLAD